MAWTYEDFEQQTTDAAKLSRLHLHIAEVREKYGGKQSVSGGGMSLSVDTGYLSGLEARRAELETRVRRFNGRTPLSFAHTQR
jgi:hypothetical protein